MDVWRSGTVGLGGWQKRGLGRNLFFFQAEDGIRDLVRSRGIGDVYKRQASCITWPVKELCTGRHDGKRELERSEFAEAVEKNKSNYQNNYQLYRKRQEINEHIFGTIKRQWNLYYTNPVSYKHLTLPTSDLVKI